MLAVIARAPELALTNDEAHALAVGIADVQKHYDFGVLDPKYVALAMLGVTVVKVYGGKMLSIAQRKNREKQLAEMQMSDNGGPVQVPAQTLPDVFAGFDPTRAN